MRRIDYHMHTLFSADSMASPRAHVLEAIARGLDEICFTDHQDFCYPYTNFDLDVASYYQAIWQLQQEFANQIIIKWGIEIGLDRDRKSVV